ncbi:Fic family protein [Azorhizobium sp. AG788]|uniref:Fic/DOC family protein n=1 Tax=Azorhizobium sp. AG788 TaxID=2183897 RepID=UPI003139282E
MYQGDPDPDCYPGTSVLRNLLDLRTQDDLDAFEHEAALARSDEPLPIGGLDVRHYQAIHHHLFQDVYAWAGTFRTVRISKGSSMFCYPEHIPAEMSRLFKGLRHTVLESRLDAVTFADRAASFLATLNAIHPFREGNGRTQLTFLAFLAHESRHPLDFGRVSADRLLDALIRSFAGDEAALRAAMVDLTGPTQP